jgi:hypothetical protein
MRHQSTGGGVFVPPIVARPSSSTKAGTISPTLAGAHSPATLLALFRFRAGLGQGFVQIEYVAPFEDGLYKFVRLGLADVANYDTRTVLKNGLEANLSIA